MLLITKKILLVASILFSAVFSFAQNQQDNINRFISIDGTDGCFYFQQNKRDSLIIDSYYANILNGGIIVKDSILFRCMNCYIYNAIFDKYYIIWYGFEGTGGFKTTNRNIISPFSTRNYFLLNKYFKPITKRSYARIDEINTYEVVDKNNKIHEFLLLHAIDHDMKENILLLNLQNNKLDYLVKSRFIASISYTYSADPDVQSVILSKKDSTSTYDSIFVYHYSEELSFAKKVRKRKKSNDTKTYDAPVPVIENPYKIKNQAYFTTDDSKIIP